MPCSCAAYSKHHIFMRVQYVMQQCKSGLRCCASRSADVCAVHVMQQCESGFRCCASCSADACAALQR